MSDTVIKQLMRTTSRKSIFLRSFEAIPGIFLYFRPRKMILFSTMQVHHIHLETVDSTSDWAKAHAHEFDAEGLTCVSAVCQTQGHGRFKRPWVSKEGNLHVSLFFCLPKNDTRIPHLAQISALALFRFLEEMEVTTSIKWPNDLLFERKKLSGILVETIDLGEKLGIVVGIGMNVNATVEGAISLIEIVDKRTSLNWIYDTFPGFLLKELDKEFDRKTYLEHLAFLGERVSFQYHEDLIEGIFLGLSENGNLKLKLDDGEVAQFSSGSILNVRST